MSDRLSELLRQRALLQEHLAWLDREIDGAARTSSNAALPRPIPTDVVSFPPTPELPHVSVAAIPPAPSVPALTARLAVPASPAENVVVSGAEAILDRYRVEPRSVQQDVRKGCLLYFAAAFVLLGLGVTALYFLISSR